MNKPHLRWMAFGGYLMDLWQLARGLPINPRSLNKFQIINAARKNTGATQFIEVGTFRGITALRCSRVFEKVYTIELSEDLHRQAKAFLSSRKNIELCLGDGLDWIEKLLQRPEVDNVLIFLDGHFSGGITAQGDQPEPALEEIELLAPYQNKIAAIVIDDFRTFGTQEGVPKKSTLLKTIEEHFPNYELQVHLDQCLVTRKKNLGTQTVGSSPDVGKRLAS